MKKLIKRYIDEYEDVEEMPTTLNDMLSYLALKLSEVPEQYRDEATIEFKTDDESSAVWYDIYYTEQESDEMYATRLAVEEENKRRNQERMRASTLAEFERLKIELGLAV